MTYTPHLAGTAATVSVGTVTTGAAGTSAAVTNAGTSSSAVLNFTIPKGDSGTNGTNGAAATVSVGTVTTLAAGSSATVTNTGTSSAAVLAFGIPQGASGGSGSLPSGWVDVTAGPYNADPTGVADASTAFTSAKNSGASVMWVPAGTYKLGNFVWDKEINIWGPGSRFVTIKSTGNSFGLIIRPASSGSKTSIRGITLDGSSSTQASTLCGVLIQRKVYAEDFIVQNFPGDGARFAPYDASTTDGTGGTIGNAVFFSDWKDCQFISNGGDGLVVRMGANANNFYNIQCTKNKGVGLHHLTDGGATYGNNFFGGQCSYNSSYGWHFESGTNLTALGLYSEYNGSPTNTNTDGYTNTPFDIVVGSNCSRSDIQCGTVFNNSNTHVSAPTSGLNDSIIVKVGGDRIFGSTASHTPHEVAGPAAPSFATLADAQTFCAALRTALLSGGTLS